MIGKKIKQYILAFVFLLIVDFIWLGLIAKPFYDSQFLVFQRTLIVWSAAAAWLLIPLGIVLFVLPLSKKMTDAIKNGALYGFILYGVYDFTNYATLSNWSIKLVIVDILWGTFLCSITSITLFYLTKKCKL